ncbi:hypothetical protein ALC56_05471 [Trachymyrmex septentrionalis]|uniref:Uncharacterized protein n=1 Tax=Trachymyrmex septentrionalis TaxID=34720 RepID=A0A195FJI5_9HYME|nr:hypothetical protein ALC56_05471 [Trachymyrmex septentrionalis]
MAGGREREEVGRGVMGDGERVGEDGRGHYGNHAWVSGLRIGEMVWVMFQRALEWISLALLPNGRGKDRERGVYLGELTRHSVQSALSTRRVPSVVSCFDFNRDVSGICRGV